MSGGRRKAAPRATHQPVGQYLPIPGNNTDGLNTKIGRGREKAAKTAAKKAAKEKKPQTETGC